MFVMGTFYPILSVLTHIAEVAVYAVSTYGQSGPDTLDPEHPSKGAPWYLRKSCSVVHRKSNYGYCEQAKACFAVTVIMMSMFAIYLLLSIYSSIPTRREKLARLSKFEESDIPEYEPETMTGRQPWEKRGSEVCLAPMNPAGRNLYTSRTVAFQHLEGGQEGTSAKDLPFRERYGE
jgi:hypothetical protein